MHDEIIKILLIEDDKVDQMAFKRLVRDNHLPYDYVITSSVAETRDVLASTMFDVIIMDYLLGDGTAFDLFDAAGDTPVILATGVGSEEIAVNAMKAGAYDYLIKDHERHYLKVLPLTVANALKSKRAQEALKASVAQIEKSRDDLLSILNQLRLGTAMTDENGRLTFLSDTCQHLLGKSHGEAVGTHWADLLPLATEDKARLTEMLEPPPSRRAKVAVHMEVRDGQHYWMEIEIHDDPRHSSRKIFTFYDMTEVHDLRRQLDAKAQFQELIGKSRPMELVYHQIREVARVDSTVLIEGETGTGKELVARAIHALSHRRDHSFIAVNCAGLTDSLLGSQLFGHKRGAFTGAIADHQGLFEAANGGTLFLDEIGDIPLSVQTSLLRVLQEREITRLGESRPRPIDVRVLAATHHNLAEEVDKGTFRSDLLYRIRVARLQLPALRARREDVPLLVAWFLGHSRAATGKQVQDVSHEAMCVLLDYPWPGNVRELKSAIEFATIRCQGTVIRREDLPPEIGDLTLSPLVGNTPDDERQQLLTALEQARGNRTAAARLLGISRATFYRRLASLDISPEI